ncbi:uncharacterized protein Thert_03054 [Thermoanaerobacterium thermosaccharolyticum]|uniref:Uncharacterized protein n=1 Tax=Thermoanaerobacterium thermosaccharolyticum TaxID=1517 RepID=A0A223I275_THETR|nr:uncharacterized protein Thert_03054 [Thermoanaerobacterium thermosaccharolyticum]
MDFGKVNDIQMLKVFAAYIAMRDRRLVNFKSSPPLMNY